MPKLNYVIFRQRLLERAKRIPLDTYIEVTYRCSLDCRQCYNPVNRLSGLEMSAGEIINYLDLLSEAGGLWLNFTGGEPFIRRDFFEFYNYAVARGFICCIQSNGTLISREIAASLAENPPYAIDISVYGAGPATYEKVTGSASGYGACMAGIENLLEAGIKPSLKTTVTKDNKEDVWRLRAFAEEKGLIYGYDPHIHPRIDGDKFPQSLRLSPQEAAEIMLGDEKRHKDWREYLELYLGEPHPERLVVCGALQDGFWIDPYGNLRICAIVPKPVYSLRQGGTLEDAWDKFSVYIRQEELKAKKEDNPCLSCKLFSFCGHCIGWSDLEHNDWNQKVDYLCEIARLQEIKLKELGLWPVKAE